MTRRSENEQTVKEQINPLSIITEQLVENMISSTGGAPDKKATHYIIL